MVGMCNIGIQKWQVSLVSVKEINKKGFSKGEDLWTELKEVQDLNEEVNSR